MSTPDWTVAMVSHSLGWGGCFLSAIYRDRCCGTVMCSALSLSHTHTTRDTASNNRSSRKK